LEKKVQKKVRKYYKLSEGRGGVGRGGRDGGELSFQCLRPSTSLMAAGKKQKVIIRAALSTTCSQLKSASCLSGESKRGGHAAIGTVTIEQ
jgi:hypothetical protein